jgi:hypothetical protein
MLRVATISTTLDNSTIMERTTRNMAKVLKKIGIFLGFIYQLLNSFDGIF